MKQAQFFIGIGLALFGALLMVVGEAPYVIPVAITIGILGIILIAGARRLSA